jgi:translation initiation factor 3 subunit C
VKKAAATEEDGQAASADFTTIGKGGKVLNLTAEGILKTLRDIFEQRGRKNTDRAETIRILVKLLEVAETTYQRLRVLLALVPARLDYSQALPSIPHDSWVSGRSEMDQLFQLLLDNPDYIVEENVEEYDDLAEREPETVDGQAKRVKVSGNLISLLENLDNEVSNRRYISEMLVVAVAVADS